MPQDDPPREAVEALVQVLRYAPGEASGILRTLHRRLPAAARWRLAAWIVADLEPTEAMADVMLRQSMHHKTLQQLLASARAEEARDG